MRTPLSHISFDPDAWEDYLYWQQHNPATLQRINTMIAEIQQNPRAIWRKSVPLSDPLTKMRSIRIVPGHYLVYIIRDWNLIILQCRYHNQIAN
jgi:toxin YoeB